MSQQTKNSCAKAFGNWSRNKNFKSKKLRGVKITPPPMPSRVNILLRLWILRLVLKQEVILYLMALTLTLTPGTAGRAGKNVFTPAPQL